MGNVEEWWLFCEAHRPGGGSGSPGNSGHTVSQQNLRTQEDYAAFRRMMRDDAPGATWLQMVAVIIAFSDFVSDVVWAVMVRKIFVIIGSRMLAVHGPHWHTLTKKSTAGRLVRSASPFPVR